jgi:hypothetical protein
LPKEKIARFRIENRQFQHPETNEFPDGNLVEGTKDEFTFSGTVIENIAKGSMSHWGICRWNSNQTSSAFDSLAFTQSGDALWVTAMEENGYS